MSPYRLSIITVFFLVWLCKKDPYVTWILSANEKLCLKKNPWLQKGTICHMIPFCTNINSHVIFLHNQNDSFAHYIFNYLINYRYYRPNFVWPTRYILIHCKIIKRHNISKCHLVPFCTNGTVYTAKHRLISICPHIYMQTL